MDILKLDMRFLAGEGLGGRGGIIVNAVVQMAKWLNTATIAEGVETIEQADFLKSIGCNYIQGYLYSKPMRQEDLMMILLDIDIEPTQPSLLLKAMNAERFWDPDSLETLIFNNYVGAAAIFSYEKGDAEILRVNPKYVKEIGMNMTEKEILGSSPWDHFTEEGRKLYEDTIKTAMRTGEEESCETWRLVSSKCCGRTRSAFAATCA